MWQQLVCLQGVWWIPSSKIRRGTADQRHEFRRWQTDVFYGCGGRNERQERVPWENLCPNRSLLLQWLEHDIKGRTGDIVEFWMLNFAKERPGDRAHWERTTDSARMTSKLACYPVCFCFYPISMLFFYCSLTFTIHSIPRTKAIASPSTARVIWKINKNLKLVLTDTNK